jgi:nicotinamidase/pyrazinamidase
MKFDLTPTDALIIVDPQIDFMPGGALAVAGGQEIVPLANWYSRLFGDAGATVVITQDWHSQDQISFASNHKGKKPFTNIKVKYGEQTLWPDHCVQGSVGAEFHPALNLSRANAVFQKGADAKVDSYSAFYENDRETSTGLGEWLKERGITRIFVIGLAYDFCVAYTAIHGAEKESLETIVLKDATRAIGLGDSIDFAESEFKRVGVRVVDNLNDED